MKVVIIQPPIVQLNTPYPSGAYLQDFFKKLKSFGETDNQITTFTDSPTLSQNAIKIAQKALELQAKEKEDFSNICEEAKKARADKKEYSRGNETRRCCCMVKNKRKND